MKDTTKQKNFLVLVSAILLFNMTLLNGGCALPKVKPVDKTVFSDRLQFLTNGTTSREEVLLKLGEPSGRFEGEHILTYMLLIDGNKNLRILPRQLAISNIDPRLYNLNPTICSLVLIFKNDNILEKSELICSGDELK